MKRFLIVGAALLTSAGATTYEELADSWTTVCGEQAFVAAR